MSQIFITMQIKLVIIVSSSNDCACVIHTNVNLCDNVEICIYKNALHVC